MKVKKENKKIDKTKKDTISKQRKDDLNRKSRKIFEK